MKTTLEIDEALLAEVEAVAARARLSVSAFVEQVLRERVGAEVPKAELVKPPKLRVYTAGAGGMHPWIDPCSNESMLDAMDGFDGP